MVRASSPPYPKSQVARFEEDVELLFSKRRSCGDLFEPGEIGRAPWCLSGEQLDVAFPLDRDVFFQEARFPLFTCFLPAFLSYWGSLPNANSYPFPLKTRGSS